MSYNLAWHGISSDLFPCRKQCSSKVRPVTTWRWADHTSSLPVEQVDNNLLNFLFARGLTFWWVHRRSGVELNSTQKLVKSIFCSSTDEKMFRSDQSDNYASKLTVTVGHSAFIEPNWSCNSQTGRKDSRLKSSVKELSHARKLNKYE